MQRDALEVGDTVILRATFYDRTDSLVDPIVLHFYVQPEGQQKEGYIYGVSPSLERVSLGVYELSYDIEFSGHHAVRVEMEEGQRKGVFQSSFVALASSVT